MMIITSMGSQHIRLRQAHDYHSIAEYVERDMYYGAVGASISIAICSLMSVEDHLTENPSLGETGEYGLEEHR